MFRVNPMAFSAAMGAAAYSLWRNFPGIVYIHGDRATGKTTLLRQMGDFIAATGRPDTIVSFIGSTPLGILRSGASLVDDVPSTAGRVGEERLAELARICRNFVAVVTDDATLTPPPIMFVTGELPLKGATQQRVLLASMRSNPGVDVRAFEEQANREARTAFALRYSEWLDERDGEWLRDEYQLRVAVDGEDPLSAAGFGVLLLNRFLEWIGVSDSLMQLAFTSDNVPYDLLPSGVASLVTEVVEAVGSGDYQLIGGGGLGGKTLGRIDGTKVCIIPAVATELLSASGITTTSRVLASDLDQLGLLTKEGAGDARTVTRRIDGKVIRVWEIDGLFSDEDLSLLRGGL